LHRGVTVLAAVVLVALMWAGARPVGPAPPLGPFFDPANGIWSVPASAEFAFNASASIPGLSALVRVVYDDRGVPHIFAASELDAQRALGYVVARDRLFQLELQARAGAGTLTELVGPRALAADQEMRRLGVARAAEETFAALDSTSGSRRAIEAFAAGVNARIRTLSARDVPVEYKLLGRWPATWTPINSIHLLHRMGWLLATNHDEQVHLRADSAFGRTVADALYPINSPIQEPIQPNGRGRARVDTTRLPVLGAAPAGRSTTATTRAPAARDAVNDDATGNTSAASSHTEASDVALGSNNWVVSPKRTRDGYALLAGDPHLDLTLPSIWYEAHLVVLGLLDTYGVTMPGAPTIVIGFNRNVAWTFTNTGADVMDYYAETVNDSLRPTQYVLDGVWKPLRMRIERYRGPRGNVIATDTLRYTHRGPMQRVNGQWRSVRWTVLDTSDENSAFLRATRAHSVAEWLGATAAWVAPAQNMAVADRAGSIAIRSTGRFPYRPGDGRGDLMRDGSTAASDWEDVRSIDRYPRVLNPLQGFAASANQQPIDPRYDPGYLGSDWPAPWRAMRINTLLRADSAVTPDAMRLMQTDPGSERAEIFVPAFLAAARAHRPEFPALTRAATLLAQWDRRYTKDNQRAVLFENAMRALSARLWDELRRGANTPGAPLPTPSEAVLVQLLHDPASAWWDDRRTPPVEHRDDILAASLVDALDTTLKAYGEPDKGGWAWNGIRFTNIWHLLGLPSFSALRLPMQGGPGTLNPSSGDGREGSSWRMVVELGPEVRAWGIYPGGQSGNPTSRRYVDRLQRWMRGELDTLRFPRTPDDLLVAQRSGVLTLVPKRWWR
jgi:penicillin amidase